MKILGLWVVFRKRWALITLLCLLQNVTMVMTSVSGHLLAHDFKLPFRKWLVLSTPSQEGELSSSVFNPELSRALLV